MTLALEKTSPDDDLESVLRERLANLTPLRLELVDESAKHAGHEGAKSGGRHYRLLIISTEFSGKSILLRHRLIYDTLGELMRSKINALSIQALAPGEGA